MNHKTSAEHPLRRLWAYAAGRRRTVVLATLFTIVNKLFDLAPPFLVGIAVDVVVRGEQSFVARFGVADPAQQLVLLGLLTLLIWALESVSEYIFQVLWRNLAQNLQHGLRRDAYGHVQQLELSFFEDRSTGGLLAVLNDDINQLERFLDSGAAAVIHLLTTIVVVGAMFLVLVPGVAWMAVLPMPFIIWGSLRFQSRLAPLYLRVREQAGMLNGYLANNLAGIATIKSYTTEAHELARISRESDLYQARNREAIRLSSAFVPLIRMVIVLGYAAILVFGGRLALDGGLNVGIYSTLVFMTQRLLWPLTRLGETLDLYQRAMASTSRVLDLLSVRREIISGAVRLPAGTVRGELALEGVSFTYRGRGTAPMVHNLSLHIPAGQTVAIVGPTGAGKSTLVKLLLRFYDVQAGRITLDGHDVRTLDLTDLRRAIGYVSQEVFLFHGTVRENIAYGTPEASPEAIAAAARAAEAHGFISALPQGYETIVGERGQKLSGGQRQRISIARAVLKDPPVLILDEATSSVDNETEAAIQRSLERIAVGRTTIVIAHRLSTVRNADRIYVLEDGALRESGRHDELVRAPGMYAALWRVQTGERETATS